MSGFYEEDEVNPRIEFIKVEPEDFDDGMFNDTEIEDPKELQRIIRLSPKVQPHTRHNPVKRKVIRVQYCGKNNHVLPNKKFRPTVSVYKEDTVKRPKKMCIPMLQEHTIKLIKRVEKESCIWSSTNEHYKNKEIKDKAWNRVAAHTGIRVEIARAKWTSLLGSFRSYTSRYKKGLCSDKKPRWFAYDLLSFLNNEIEESAQGDDSELPYVCADAKSEEYEVPERPQSEDENNIQELRQDTVEYLEEELFHPETAPTIVNRIGENNTASDSSEASCNEEILRIVRSMSKVLNKMANIGMPVDYGRYVNEHLKVYDDEIRRKTVKGLMDLITAADEEMSKKYPDGSQPPGTNVQRSRGK
uniref:MADF domain-containing protein n=1 Tax=Anopheles funestus TaxID=62324 RepID=A0A182RTM2_ANOFN